MVTVNCATLPGTLIESELFGCEAGAYTGGMSNARPKQAAACWLVELGNGDKFLFDIGTGSAERIAAMQIPYNYLNKVFIGHLYSDHFGDLGALYCGGIVANRVVPLEVWGPNSVEEKYGTRYAMEAFEKVYAWDILI